MRRTSEGFALPTALLAMVVIGAMVTGGFYAVSQERRIVESPDLAAQALFVARLGLREALAEDSPGAIAHGRRSLQVTVYRSSSGSAAGSYTIHVREMGGDLVLVTSEGRVKAGREEVVRTVSTLVSTSASPSAAQLPADRPT